MSVRRSIVTDNVMMKLRCIIYINIQMSVNRRMVLLFMFLFVVDPYGGQQVTPTLMQAQKYVCMFRKHPCKFKAHLCKYTWKILCRYDWQHSENICVSTLWNAVTSTETVFNGNSLKTKLYNTSSPILHCISQLGDDNGGPSYSVSQNAWSSEQIMQVWLKKNYASAKNIYVSTIENIYTSTYMFSALA